MASVNEMIKMYQNLMEGKIVINDTNSSVKENEKHTEETKNKLTPHDEYCIISAYNKKAYSHKPPVVLTDFINRFCPASNEETFFFFKALRDIETDKEIKNGEILTAYALEMLKSLSDEYMPLSISNYTEYKKDIYDQLSKLVDFGVKSKILKIAEAHKEMININHSEAAMDAEAAEGDKVEEAPVTTEETKETPVEETKESKVEKETTKDDKDKKKEERKKKNEENRKNTEKYFNYDSIDAVAPDLKDNKPAWYRVANRVATLLIREDVQNIIGDQKFSLLIYHDGNDFAIINDQNNNINQGYNIFWFKEKEAERFTDSNLFNMKWAEAHQNDQNKFVA